MREYAEVHRGFVVGFHKRDDTEVPQFMGRVAIRVDKLRPKPNVGDEYANGVFIAPTRPNPNLEPPPPTDREILEKTREAVDRILDLLRPGPP